MSRALWIVAFSVAATRSPAWAEDDGPQPVNTTASVSAGADDDIMSGHEAASASTSDRVQGHPAGTYTGVAPGGSATPAVGMPAGKSPATITWPGFQMRPDGTSRVFIQSTAPLNPQPSAAPNKYLVLLPGARVSGGTNRLPLETRFFNTPVTKVSLSVNRDGAQLILDLRADVAPQISTERDSTGYYFTYIDLPKGHFVVAADKPKPTSPAPIAAVPATAAGIGPADLTTQLDSASQAAAAAHATRSAERELPPGVKAHTSMSGGLKLGK
jgi:hypothetical protein